MLLLATLGHGPLQAARLVVCVNALSFALSSHYLLDSEAYDMKTFNIGNNRILKLGKSNNDIRILDKTTKTFTPARWASFLLYLDEIQVEDVNSHKARTLPIKFITVEDGTSR